MKRRVKRLRLQVSTDKKTVRTECRDGFCQAGIDLASELVFALRLDARRLAPVGLADIRRRPMRLLLRGSGRGSPLLATPVLCWAAGAAVSSLPLSARILRRTAPAGLTTLLLPTVVLVMTAAVIATPLAASIAVVAGRRTAVAIVVIARSWTAVIATAVATATFYDHGWLRHGAIVVARRISRWISLIGGRGRRIPAVGVGRGAVRINGAARHKE